MFDEETLMKNAVQAWKRHHEMTYSFLDQLTEEQLQVKLPREGLTTFAKHFQEMADVQNSYAEALHTGKLDFTRLANAAPYSGKATKAELRAEYGQADQAIENGLRDCPSDRVIDIFGMAGARADLVQTLLHHELFHHGQFFLLAHGMKMDVPKNWRDFWWMPQLFP
jgi:uncharacterized damage-inducible protein DinB